MNCQTFEPAVNDLARGQMMEAALRESALAHAGNCARCAARLADEQALNNGLRAFASSLETLEAPAQLETALRAAFRQRNTTKAPAPVISIASARKQSWMAWATAAAAAIATVFAIQAFRLREPNAPLHRAANTVSLSSSNAIALAPSAKINSDVAYVPARGVNPIARQPRATLNATNRSTLAAGYASESRNARSAGVAKAAQAEQEVVTDFMPLTYGAALSPNEGGQLVRVELPRSALLSMGLPMNVEKSDERVKADVFLGHDGLARAIRFVR
jgi:hypothetical protein